MSTWWCDAHKQWHNTFDSFDDLFEDDDLDDDLSDEAFERVFREWLASARNKKPAIPTPRPKNDPLDDKLMRMATQNVSPRERDIAIEKLKARGKWPT